MKYGIWYLVWIVCCENESCMPCSFCICSACSLLPTVCCQLSAACPSVYCVCFLHNLVSEFFVALCFFYCYPVSVSVSVSAFHSSQLLLVSASGAIHCISYAIHQDQSVYQYISISVYHIRLYILLYIYRIPFPFFPLFNSSRLPFFPSLHLLSL
jgi:hypothetical protein